MDLDSIRFFTEIATVGLTALAALGGVKLGLNGLRRDAHNTACDVQEIKTSLKDAAVQRNDLDRRLAYVEGEVTQVTKTLARMEGS